MDMSINTIDQLNMRVLVKLAPSPIHGIGVFAIRDIEKGRKLYADSTPLPYKLNQGDFSKLLPEVSALIIERWPLVLTGSAFAYPDARIMAYMNHSDDPNYDNQNDVALRNIKAGEEITENYRNITGWEEAFPWLV